MTSNESGNPSNAPERDAEDDDLDLLTYNEARVRLAEEVLVEEKHLAELRASEGPEGGSDEKVDLSVRRLAGLRDALERTSRRAITDKNAAAFYGRDLNGSDPVG